MEGNRQMRCAAAFSVVDRECAEMVVAVAEEESSDVVLCIDADRADRSSIERLCSWAIPLARSAVSPVGISFINSRNLETVMFALGLGFTSISFDGSFLPLPQNLELTARAAEAAHSAGAALEGVIGAFGDFGKDSIGNSLVCGLAQSFALETGIDILGVSIPSHSGNDFRLDKKNLGILGHCAPMGLFLHDADLLGSREISRAVSAGVAGLIFTDTFRNRTIYENGRPYQNHARMKESIRHRLRLLGASPTFAIPHSTTPQPFTE